MNHDDFYACLMGEKLYGNDFTVDQIMVWFKEEEEAYASLYSEVVKGNYPYHGINIHNAFRYLKKPTYGKAMSIGGAFGDELLPVIDKIDEVIILEPSETMTVETIRGKPVSYIKPKVSGEMPFENNYFDLITCSGVLHHIPNVEYVISEISRVLKPGGTLVLREPIVSMGDWRSPRRGLTKHERGIPLHILRKFLLNNQLSTKNETFCFTKPFDVIVGKFLKYSAYSKAFYPSIDALLGKLLLWNYRYHATKLWHKVRPSAVFYVLEKV